MSQFDPIFWDEIIQHLLSFALKRLGSRRSGNIAVRDQDFFWDGVKDGKLLLQKCGDCGAIRQPPGPMCPHCQSLNWVAHESAGRGTVAALIISKHPTQPDDNPRFIALIDLDEGVRMISNLQDVERGEIALGMPVELVFAEVFGTLLPQFRPAIER